MSMYTNLRYLEKAKCIISQYSNYSIKELDDLAVNGVNTQVRLAGQWRWYSCKLGWLMALLFMLAWHSNGVNTHVTFMEIENINFISMLLSACPWLHIKYANVNRENLCVVICSHADDYTFKIHTHTKL